MSDQKTREDEEYQYPKDEYVVEPNNDAKPNHSAEQQSSQPNEETVIVGKPESAIKQFVLKNRRMLIAVFIGFVLLLIFQFMKHSEHKKVMRPTVAATNSQQAVEPAVEPSPQQDAQLAQSLVSIQNSGSDNAEKIQRLQSSLQQLRYQLDSANQANDELKKTMHSVLQALEKVNQRLDWQEKKMVVTTAPVKERMYSIRAIIEGRAWIVNGDGVVESVTVGDLVPELGTVKQIDANRGLVLTSSGQVIQYGKK